MIRKIIGILFILSIASCQGGASRVHRALGISDIIRISKMTHDETIGFLTGERYSLVSSATVFKQRITQMRLKNKTLIIDMTKSQWTDDGQVYEMVHLDINPLTLAETFYAELLKLGFKLKERNTDDRKDFRLYVKEFYTVSIYRFKDAKLQFSIELHALPYTGL